MIFWHALPFFFFKFLKDNSYKMTLTKAAVILLKKSENSNIVKYY